MSFIGSFGSFLGGATAEAAKIRQEREDREQKNLGLTMSILQNIIDNPQIDNPQLKQEAFDATRDVLMTHLFPGQFKAKGGKLSKLVEQFVGQNSDQQGAQLSGILSQLGGEGRGEGAGRGNAQSSVGGLNQPMRSSVPMPTPQAGEPLPPPLQSDVNQGDPTQGVNQMAMQGGPPPVPTALQPPPRTSAGFVSPSAQAEYERQRARQESREDLTYRTELEHANKIAEIEATARANSEVKDFVTPDPKDPSRLVRQVIDSKTGKMLYTVPYVDPQLESVRQTYISSGITPQAANKLITDQATFKLDLDKAQAGVYNAQASELRQRVQQTRDGIIPPQLRIEFARETLRLATEMVMIGTNPFTTEEELKAKLTRTLQTFGLSLQEIGNLMQMAVSGKAPTGEGDLFPAR